jgi:hypothetical protein
VAGTILEIFADELTAVQTVLLKDARANKIGKLDCIPEPAISQLLQVQ